MPECYLVWCPMTLTVYHCFANCDVYDVAGIAKLRLKIVCISIYENAVVDVLLLFLFLIIII